MKEVHLRLWDVAHREIIEILDMLPYEADWVCLNFFERVWLLTADQLEACGCQNCDRHARLRFWVSERRKAEVELEKLGCDRPRSRSWAFGPQD